jgi:hypothetical protein
MKLKLLDLFSGIGGFSLGLESTGYFETIGFVEKDEFCQKVLKKNFNSVNLDGSLGKMLKALLMEKRKKYRESIGRKTVPPGNLLEQIQMMYPTPTASDIEGGEAKDVQIENGRFFRENKKGERWGVKLRDAMTLLPTPTARDHKDMGYQPTWKPSRDKSLPREVLKNNKPGGKLNPNFVEHLMAYPMNWTKIEKTE